MYKRTTINESVQPRFLDIEEFMTYTSLGRTSAMRLGRYKPTRYTKEAEMLEKIGDVYQLSTTGIPTDNQMVDTWDTQDRLGKQKRSMQSALR